ncbi:MAG TPA: biotin--[acetyl-CoA-carboxylase] ligase [Methanocorpusculum sp.]|nr:biotin--[acetyl-CoA-carboxylase] ligase [Methanocorpusculum sp.]
MTQTIFDLLRILDEAGMNTFVSAETISEKLGITRTATWKYVNILRDSGYVIDALRTKGYALKKRTLLLLPYEVKRHLSTKIIGQEMHHFDEVQSTNALARRMMAEVGCEAQHGTVLIAEKQSGGAGRLNRVWISPVGGIWATIVLKPKMNAENSFILMASASVALAKTIKHDFNLSALIGWPNDIYIGDKKVAGTTLELSADDGNIRYCLLGIGVDANLNIAKVFPSMRDEVTSISDELGHEIERGKFFAHFLKEFERRYQMILKDETEAIFCEWKSLSNTLHRRVRIRTIHEGFDGEALDIDEKGALLIHRDNGDVERVIAGDCTTLK